MGEIEKMVPKVWGAEKWIVNGDYCGKMLLLVNGFRCSMHYHKEKDETFYLLNGSVLMEVEDEHYIMKPGQTQLILPRQRHRFTGLEDSRLLEFSTHHTDEDSYREEISGQVDLNKLMTDFGYKWDGGILE